MVELEEPQTTSQYAAYEAHAGQARLYARTRTHTPRSPGTRTQARARTHTHTHTQKYIKFIACPRQQ